MKYLKLFVPAILAVALSGCLNDEESELERQVRLADEQIQTYLQENDIEAEESSTGVYYEVLESNALGEKVTENRIVSVIYNMKLLSGTLIEDYQDDSNPVKFSYSPNALIPVGLNYEIGRMRVGETFRFYIPSYLAYENYKHDGLFDANSNFILEVKVVELLTEADQLERENDLIQAYLDENSLTADVTSSGLRYISTLEGANNSPSAFSTVKVHFTRKYLDGTVIKSTLSGQPQNFQLGQNNLVPGFEEGLKKMKKGGKATMILPSKIAFGKSLQVIPQKVREDWVEDEKLTPETVPFAPVIYEVELVDIL